MQSFIELDEVKIEKYGIEILTYSNKEIFLSSFMNTTPGPYSKQLRHYMSINKNILSK